jgi:cellulose synthase/poly-beta-1,6-N-acetylglucosamine synthase-like glycosyltransferase
MRAINGCIKRANSSVNIDLFIVLTFVFSSIFVGLTILSGLSLKSWASFLGIFYFFGFEMLFVGIAYDLTEVVLALLLAPEALPRQSPLKSFPPVALLITVCDDVIPEILKRLQDQTYPNYDIFILDDSLEESQHALVDQSGHAVLRRGTRRAFKAGNLNHWLDKYGFNYKYFVVLDSDSLIPENFITCMVEYAEHPHNERIAVFQSKILPWNRSSFPRVLGAVSPLRHYILERVANRTDMLLAYGQNNLNKTRCILEVGGFHENATAEDTALTLMLSTKGYSVKLVDIASYNTEPQNAFYYSRQIARWAAQTVELFRLPWQSVTFRMKLRLCYDLYRYFVPSILLALFLVTAWTLGSDSWSLHNLINSIINDHLYQAPWFLTFLAMANLWGLLIALHFVLARKSGVTLRNYLLFGLLSNALMYFVIIPVNLAMLRTALGAKVQFNPTNTRISHIPTLRAVASRMWPSIAYGMLVVAGIAYRNRVMFLSFNLVWLLLLLAAPIVLWLFHVGNKTLGEEANEL